MKNNLQCIDGKTAAKVTARLKRVVWKFATQVSSDLDPFTLRHLNDSMIAVPPYACDSFILVISNNVTWCQKLDFQSYSSEAGTKNALALEAL